MSSYRIRNEWILSPKLIWPSGLLLSEFQGMQVEFLKFSPLRACIYLLYFIKIHFLTLRVKNPPIIANTKFLILFWDVIASQCNNLMKQKLTVWQNAYFLIHTAEIYVYTRLISVVLVEMEGGLNTGSSKKMDGIWNRYNLKSTRRIYTFGILKCSEKLKVLDLP